MRPDLAQAAMQFIARVDLKVQEIPALQQVMQALEAEAKQPTEVENDDGSTTIHAGSDAG